MESYKKEFVNLLRSKGSLKLRGDFELTGGRISPYFINLGNFDDGASLAPIGEFYADAILSSKADFDLLYGIPEKGIGLVTATAIGLAKKGVNKPWFFTRKFPKDHGETSNSGEDDLPKKLTVGRAPKDGDSILQIDDVFTAGDKKYEARKTLQGLGSFNLPFLAIAVDRQEVGVNGESAILTYERKTGTKVYSILNISDICNILVESLPESKDILQDIQDLRSLRRIISYQYKYGTEESKESMSFLEQRIREYEQRVTPVQNSTLKEQSLMQVKRTELPATI